jgi:hypothetical protein
MTTAVPESGRTKVVSLPELETTTIPPRESVELPMTKLPPEFSVNVEPPFVIIATVVEMGGGGDPASLLSAPESPGPELLVPVIEGGGFEAVGPLFSGGV